VLIDEMRHKLRKLENMKYLILKNQVKLVLNKYLSCWMS